MDGVYQQEEQDPPVPPRRVLTAARLQELTGLTPGGGGGFGEAAWLCLVYREDAVPEPYDFLIDSGAAVGVIPSWATAS